MGGPRWGFFPILNFECWMKEKNELRNVGCWILDFLRRRVRENAGDEGEARLENH